MVSVSFVELSTLVYPISKSGPTQTSVLVEIISPRLRTRLVGEIGYQGYPPHQNVRSSGLHSGINSSVRKARAFARAAP